MVAVSRSLPYAGAAPAKTMEAAAVRRHEVATLEHVLLAFVDEPDT